MANLDSNPTYSKVKDLTGQTFGTLTVLGIAKKVRGTVYWLCRCKCGVNVEARCDWLQGQNAPCTLKDPNRTSQVCIRCHEAKPIDDFRIRHKGNSVYREGSCKPCERDVQRKTRKEKSPPKRTDSSEEQHERNKQKAREWKLANRERVRENKRAWRQANKEKVNQQKREKYQRDREKLIERTNEWVRANPEKARANKALHEARRKGAEGRYTAADVKAILIRQNGLCVYCRCDISECYTVDHIVPLSRGGSNWVENIQLVCAPCNSSKNNRTHDEYIKVLSPRIPDYFDL